MDSYRPIWGWGVGKVGGLLGRVGTWCCAVAWWEGAREVMRTAGSGGKGVMERDVALAREMVLSSRGTHKASGGEAATNKQAAKEQLKKHAYR